MPPKAIRRATHNAAARPRRTLGNAVYGEMAAEAAATARLDDSDSRPLKRPRLANKAQRDLKAAGQITHDPVPSSSSAATRTLPDLTPLTDTDGDSLALDEDDTLEFEDVVVEQQTATTEAESSTSDEDIKITILNTPNSASKSVSRNPAHKISKTTRILGHKAHLVALLGHCMLANTRCNAHSVQKQMRRLVTSPLRKLLDPSGSESQFQKNHALMKGLEQALDKFKGSFRVTSSGMSRTTWKSSQALEALQASLLNAATYDKLTSAAKSMSGSQDTGAQLFCAMLRSVGVITRLVCSLQVLPLSTSQVKQTTAQRSTVAVIVTPARTNGGTPEPLAPVTRPQKLAYPIFWTEVFDVAYQKWIPVDAVVTRTIKKPTKLEPPSAYELNQMAYVIAFDADGSAKDVTRRYTKSFNAKTRRLRLEGLGLEDAKWYHKVMRIFRASSDRSEAMNIEDAELGQREASEGMPGNILDFVGHPVYALERHLKRHEVIHPRREVGKVNAGTTANPRMEFVFRRQDVYPCRSAEQWFRLGRAIKAGAQPLKTVRARRQAERLESDDEQDTSTTIGLYSLAQTELYIPERVHRGRIPRNAFGNVDAYVPSMVPPGGSHIRHQLVTHAAAILEIDAADAVTGFKFTGRKGTAVIEGAVVPARHHDAVLAVIEGLQYEQIIDRCRTRSLASLRLWKKLLQGLKIRERVAAYNRGETIESHEYDLIMTNEQMLESAAQDDDLTTAATYTEAELIEMLAVPKTKLPARAPRRILDDISSCSDDESSESAFGNARLSGSFDTEAAESNQPSDGMSEITQAINAIDHAYPALQDDLGLGGGFLADDEDVPDADILSTHEHQHGPTHLSGDHLQADKQEQTLLPDNVKGLQSSMTEYDQRSVASRHNDTDADKESRLSHDPEDDDADPEWMVSE